MCMDLVSVETPEENTMVETIVSKFGVDGVWTSGRLCNFHGCDVSTRKRCEISLGGTCNMLGCSIILMCIPCTQ